MPQIKDPILAATWNDTRDATGTVLRYGTGMVIWDATEAGTWGVASITIWGAPETETSTAIGAALHE